MLTFRRFYAIQVPEVSLAMPDWLGASYSIAQYNYTFTDDFVLREFSGFPESSSCVVCIRWRTGFSVFRYKLWENVSEIMPTIRLYNGELIREQFCIEIWTVDAASAITLPAFTIETSASIMQSVRNCDSGVIEYTPSTSTAWISNP